MNRISHEKENYVIICPKLEGFLIPNDYLSSMTRNSIGFARAGSDPVNSWLPLIYAFVFSIKDLIVIVFVEC